MKKEFRIILLSFLLPVIFFGIAATPIQIFGCRNRGLLAVITALLSSILALAAALNGLKNKVNGVKDTSIWILSTLILVIPAVYILLSLF